MLVGDPGVGKSLVALDMAARVSLGDRWPDDSVDAFAPDAGGVLMLSEMDDIDDTLRPRLDAIGADMERISVVQNYRKVDLRGHAETVPFSQAADLAAISACIRRVRRCKLVIIDPLSAYVGAKPTRQELADFMRGLVEIAASHSVAILLVSPYSRSSHALFHYGPQGHANFGAVARSVWKIVGDPEHPDRRILLPLKNNLASDWRGLRFRIASSLDNLAPRIEWECKPLAVKVARATYQAEVPKPLGSRCRQRLSACEWLRNQLIDGGKLRVRSRRPPEVNSSALSC